MTTKHCSIKAVINGNNVQQFDELVKLYGYPIAYDLFNKVTTKKFMELYPKTQVDENGVPTLNAILSNKDIQDYIGSLKLINGLKRTHPDKEDNRSNFISLVESAEEFNLNSPLKDRFIAVVEGKDNQMIGISFLPNTQKNAIKAQEQLAVLRVNQQLEKLFNPIGVTVDTLYEAEKNAGRVGVADFSATSRIGNDFVSVIRVADTMKGAVALSEEFSHLIIRALKDNPVISRSLNILANNVDAVRQILGDEEYERYLGIYTSATGNEEEAQLMVAEEALGHLLQEAFLNEELKKTMAFPVLNKVKSSITTSVKACLKESGITSEGAINDILQVLSDAETAMSKVARDIVDGTLEVTQEQVRNSQSQAKFYSLEEQINRNLEILQQSKETELKRFKITNDRTAGEVKKTIQELDKYTNPQADTVYGILMYAKNALTTLRHLDNEFSYLDRMDTQTKFKILRKIKNYIDSYAGFIDEMAKALDMSEKDNEKNIFDVSYEIDGVEMNVGTIIKDLNMLSRQMTSSYIDAAKAAFASFMSKFLGTQITVPFGEHKGKTIEISTLIEKAESDITIVDRFLMSMANSKDILLQGFDEAVKTEKDAARQEFLDFRDEINTFREKCEKAGIKDFEWAFEKDDEGNKSGNYISQLNYAQFEKDYKKLLADLDEKYGENPTGEAARAKVKEKNDWLREHAKSPYGVPEPNQTYRNKDYDRLTQTQRDLLDEFLEIKAKMDALYPENRTGLLKAIQKRKSGAERFWGSITSGDSLIENIRESVKETFREQEDDDKIFGDKTTKGLTDFSGNEYMTLPILYTSRLANPNDISTDLIGTLYAYSYCAIEYKHMSKVVDALEVGRNLVSDPDIRKVDKTKGGNTLKERISALGMSTERNAREVSPEIIKKLQDFMETKVYQKYLKDAGNFGNSLVSKQKTVSFILRMSSLAQMGFNFLAQTANIANGIAMQNIEAVAGQFFGVKELSKADRAYMAELPKVISEAMARDKTSKLGLFAELIDLKQDFKNNTTRLKSANLLKRLFGESVAYLGQTAGDHWLYSRTAIAMAMREKVYVDGKEMSLWEAMVPTDVPGSTTLKKIDKSKIRDKNGNLFDFHEFGRKVAEINQRCFGIYNEEDLAAAHRTILGRLALQYRKWMVPLYSNRFQSARYNTATGTYHEGFYVTLWNFAKELKRGQFQVTAVWDRLSDDEKFNIKRAMTEIVQLLAVWALASLIEWPDDKNRPWALKMAEYLAKRELHELGSLVPSPILVRETMKTVQSPIPSLSAARNVFDLLTSLWKHENYVNEISSGPYKGLSTVEKNILKAPFPGVSQYLQIRKFSKEIDNSINYYARPY